MPKSRDIRDKDTRERLKPEDEVAGQGGWQSFLGQVRAETLRWLSEF